MSNILQENQQTEIAAVRLSEYTLSTQNEPFSGVAAPWEDEITFMADAVNRLRSAASHTLPGFLRYAVAGSGDAQLIDRMRLTELTGFDPVRVAPLGSDSAGPTGSQPGIIVIAALHRDSHDRFCGGLAFWHDPEDNQALHAAIETGLEPLARASLEQFAAAHACVGLQEDQARRSTLSPLAYWQLYLHPFAGHSERAREGGTILLGYQDGAPTYLRRPEKKQVD